MKRLLIIGALATSLAGCQQMAKVDAQVVSVNDKLYDNCVLLQGAAVLAIAVDDSEITQVINDAVSLYCSSARVTSTVDAAKRVAEIYKIVSARISKQR